ncbi:GtrA family protein [Kerstersia similis]|uniref:GtrA family protein n=1 Tax=Kerstersia similis TaxID=206505 RepID=UPI0039EE6471
MRAQLLSSTRHQTVRFCLNGGIATALHYLLMLALLHTGLAPTPATATGALAGALANYLLQYRYTFHSPARHAAAATKYLLSVLVSWPLNLLFFVVLHTGLALPVFPAQLLATFLLAICNYWISKRFVFL